LFKKEKVSFKTKDCSKQILFPTKKYCLRQRIGPNTRLVPKKGLSKKRIVPNNKNCAKQGLFKKRIVPPNKGLFPPTKECSTKTPPQQKDCSKKGLFKRTKD
jgi:hypothetical protein